MARVPVVCLCLMIVVPAAAAPWSVVLPETLCVGVGAVYLGDVSLAPVPAEVANLVVATGGRAGTTIGVTRQGILRRLVGDGRAAGVRFAGAERCLLVFAGQVADRAKLREESLRVAAALIPPALAGAPESWLELELPVGDVNIAGGWALHCPRRDALTPGRNQVVLKLEDGTVTQSLAVSVVLHAYGEAAVVRLGIARDRPLEPEQFEWKWVDLAGVAPGAFTDRKALLGASAARTMAAGDRLRMSDLKPTPVVLAGDPVELLVQRGGVSVTVRAFARQAGCLGQTIPVRNELTGQLVNARVTGPGMVQWRR